MSTTTELKRLSRKADYDTIHRFAVLSDDFNPIHVDREFAANSPMKGLVAHGPMSTILLIQALTQTLGIEAMQHIDIDIRFSRPIRENDTVTCEGNSRPDAPDVLDVRIVNQNNEIVIQGTATRRPA